MWCFGGTLEYLDTGAKTVNIHINNIFLAQNFVHSRGFSGWKLYHVSNTMYMRKRSQSAIWNSAFDIVTPVPLIKSHLLHWQANILWLLNFNIFIFFSTMFLCYRMMIGNEVDLRCPDTRNSTATTSAIWTRRTPESPCLAHSITKKEHLRHHVFPSSALRFTFMNDEKENHPKKSKLYIMKKISF